MAETITRQLREPFVEAAGLGITNKGLGLLGTSIPTSTYTGRQFVAGQSGLEQQAATAASGLDSLLGSHRISTISKSISTTSYRHITSRI